MNWIKIEDYNYSINENGEVRNDKTEKFKKSALDRKGYYYVSLWKNNKIKCFRIHRLLAKYFLPDYNEELDVDHIDRNRTNNNLSNLRMINHRDNTCNQSKKINCSSIYKGVTFDKQNHKWMAKIMINYKNIFLGRFNTQVEAAQAYNKYIEDNNLDFYSKNIIL